jgi:F-type H+-transporting ATPase subunit delta
MKISKLARREAKELFRSCLVNKVLDEDRVRQAVKRVIESKPRSYIEILSHFQRLVKLELDRRTAKIESAVALPQDVQAKLQAGLTKMYGAGLNVAFSQNPALLAGLRIKVGSDVYDGSVQGRLSALEQSFESYE